MRPGASRSAARGRLFDRLPPRLRKAAAKVFPDHWSFLLGEVAFYSFAVLVATGVVMALLYDASSQTTTYAGTYAPLRGAEVSRAFESVMTMSFEVPVGLVLRQTHHWAALVFTAAIAAHASRVFFTGAFRRPRRINWVVGVSLLLLALVNGFLGVSLVDDLLSGTGLRVGYTIALSLPVIGPGVAFSLFGGEFPGSLDRLFWLHVLAVPVAMAALIGLHLALSWRHTHTQFADAAQGEGALEDRVVGNRMWPAYLMRTAGLGLFVATLLVAMGAFLQINPVWRYGPFDPAAATVPAQPDWYLGWIEGALRLLPPVDVVVLGREVPSAFFAGIVLPGVIFVALYAWPFLEARLSGDHDVHHVLDRPRDRPLRTALGTTGLAFLGVLVMAASHDLQAQYLGVSVETMTRAYRVAVVAVPPAAGALAWTLCRELSTRQPAAGPPAGGCGARR